MKQIYLLWAFIAIPFMCFAQCPPGSVSFYNQGQIDYFLQAYPNCTEINGSVLIDGSATGPTTNLLGLQNITTINGNFTMDYNIWTNSLNGLNNLTHVGGNFRVTDSWFTDASALSNLAYVGGDFVFTGNNSIISSSSFLNNLTYVGGDFNVSLGPGAPDMNLSLETIPGDMNISIYITATNLNGISSIHTVGGDVSIRAPGITDMTGFQIQSIGGTLQIRECQQLVNFNGMTPALTSVNTLSISNNENLESLSGLENLTTVADGIYIQYNIMLGNVDHLENITSFNGILHITDNYVLTSLHGISQIDPGSISELRINGNHSLSLCSELNLCNYLIAGGEYNLGNNAPGCDGYDEWMYTCNSTWKNKIAGHVSFDYGLNDCSENANVMANTRVRVTGNGTYTTFTNSNGYYDMFVPEGNYTCEVDTNIDYYDPSPLSQNANFVGVGNEEIINFCVTPNQTVNDLEVVVYGPIDDPRPGFDTYYKIRYSNKGTTIMDGSVDFNYDTSMLTFLNANVNPDAATDGALSWNFTNLYPTERRYILVRFNVPAPPTVNIDDLLTVTAIVNPIEGDATPEDNVFVLNKIVIGSYDPNDKQTLQGDYILIDDIDKELHYLIRFQNMGTASAINIKVSDTIQNQLDVSTLRLLDMSHEGRMQIYNNEVDFIFDDIYLPDSTTDEPNSHGYVLFAIKPRSFVNIGDYMYNEAAIYFDYNEPVITNTTATYIDADSDEDTILDSVDNCPFTANTDQLDSDNDLIGDVCDDGIEVNPPYYMGFDSGALDPFWRIYEEHASYTDVSIINAYDVDGNGNTIKMRSNYSSYDAFLITPRLNGVNVDSNISFWAMETTNSFYTTRVGFMTDPTNPSTFTQIDLFNPEGVMELFTVDMEDYEPSMGRYFAIKVMGKTIYIDDFNYDTTLSVNQFEKDTVKIFPNPANNVLNITATNASIDKVQVTDMKGRVVLFQRAKGVSNVQLEISSLSTGMYFVNIQTDSGSETIKLLKN